MTTCIPAFQNVTVWLGGLFNPEAYITATRQCVAQANSWSLEELMLEVSVADVEGQVTSGGGFNVKGKWHWFFCFLMDSYLYSALIKGNCCKYMPFLIL